MQVIALCLVQWIAPLQSQNALQGLEKTFRLKRDPFYLVSDRSQAQRALCLRE